MTAPDRFEDERGVIQDILGPVDAVTTIFTYKGAIRGNHVHYETTQWTYIASGLLMITTREPGSQALLSKAYKPGEIACEKPGVAHAWKALEDTTVVVFSRGPRSGTNYESDTHRLSGVDRLLIPAEAPW
jgi:quercetin dioxygenase-like cupin family protein